MVHEPRRPMDSTGLAICAADRLAVDAAFAHYWAARKLLAVQGVGRAFCKIQDKMPGSLAGFSSVMPSAELRFLGSRS